MAAPVLQAQGSLAVTTDGNLTVPLPAQAANDVFIASLGAWVPNSTAGGGVAEPSGWTRIASLITGSPIDAEIVWFWKRSSGGDSNPTFVRPTGWGTGTSTCWHGRCYVIRGCTTSGDPWDEVDPTVLYSAANQPFDAVTVLGVERLVTQFCVSLDNNNLGTASGWTIGTETSTTTGTDGRQNTFRKDNVSISTSADSTTGGAAPAQGFYAFLGVSFKPPSAGPVTTPIAISAGLTMSPALGRVKRAPRSLDASAVASSALNRRMFRSVDMAVVAVPSLVPVKTKPISIAAGLTLDSQVTRAKRTVFAIPALLSSSLTLSRVLKKTTSTDLTTTPALAKQKRTLHSVVAELATTPVLGFQKITLYRIALDAVLSLSPTLGRKVGRVISVGLTVTPTLGRMAQHRLAVASLLALDLGLGRKMSRMIPASLSLVGSLTRVKVASRAFSASLSSSVGLGLVNTVFRSLDASLGLTAALVRKQPRNLETTVTLQPQISRVKTYAIALEASLLVPVQLVFEKITGVTHDITLSVTLLLDARLSPRVSRIWQGVTGVSIERAQIAGVEADDARITGAGDDPSKLTGAG
jgi:hypothetical protein